MEARDKRANNKNTDAEEDHHAHAGAGPSGFGNTASPSRATFVPPDPPPAFLDARSISPLVASHCEVVCAWIAAATHFFKEGSALRRSRARCLVLLSCRRYRPPEGRSGGKTHLSSPSGRHTSPLGQPHCRGVVGRRWTAPGRSSSLRTTSTRTSPIVGARGEGESRGPGGLVLAYEGLAMDEKFSCEEGAIGERESGAVAPGMRRPRVCVSDARVVE